MLFRKAKKYEIDMNAANSTLQNVFAACEKTPNTVPFDKLTLREKLNTSSFDRMICITIVIIFLTLLLPVIIVPACTKLDQFNKPQKVELINDYVEDGYLYIQIKGDHIQFQNAYMETLDGTVYEVISYERKTGILCFPYIEDTESNIYIPVRDAAPFHLLLSPQ